VDYENVDVAGFEGMSELCETDAVYLYYSENHNRMTFGLHRRIMDSKAGFLYRKIQGTEKNALDDELMREANTIMQQELQNNPPFENEYYIISGDKDYDGQIALWNEQGIRAERCMNIKESALTEEERLQKIREKLKKEKQQLETELNQIKNEIDQLMQEKRRLQTEVDGLKVKNKAKVQKIITRLRGHGLTEEEIKIISEHMDEILSQERAGRGNILTKLIRRKKPKKYLNAFENL